MIPDTEELLTAYLEDFPLVPSTPANTDAPWVRLTLIGDPQVTLPDHLVEAYVQLDCYAGNGKPWEQQAEANLLRRQVREKLGAITQAQHSGAVVNGVEINGGGRMPDNDFEPARERYVLTAVLWLHTA